MAFNYKNLNPDMSRITPDTIKAETVRLSEQLNEAGKTISAMDLLNRKIEMIPCLIEPILQKVGLACIAGSSDTGKSSFLRYLCMCIVSGKPDFLGFTINTEHKRAIYVSTEDDETAIAYLLHKQNKDLQADPPSLQGLEFLFNTETLLQTLDEALTVAPADVVCIDAFSDLYGRSMNEANQIRNFLNEYSQLAQKHKCLILFLHHCGKRTEDGAPSKHNLLGSQAFEAKMRLVMELRSDVVETSLKHLCIVKGNYLSAEHKSESYQLRFTDNMTFENTGERVLFESLTKENDTERQKYDQIKAYQSQGLSMEQIAKNVGYSNKSSVSRLIRRIEKSDVATPLPEATKSNEKKQQEKQDEKLLF